MVRVLFQSSVVRNFGWITFLRLTQTFITTVISIYVARTLGPEQFGKLSFALAVVLIGCACSRLGIENILKKDLILYPQHAHRLMGTAYVLKVGGAIAVYSILVAYVLPNGLTDVELILLLVGGQLLFEAGLVVDYWFQTQVEAKFSLGIMTGVIILSSCLRGLFVWWEMDLKWIAASYVFQGIVTHLLLLGTYAVRVHSPLRWRYDTQTAKSLLSRGWPMIFNGINAILYSKVDQVMLKSFGTFEEVGAYSAAARLIEICMIPPVAIGASLLPRIVKHAGTDPQQRQKDICCFFGLYTATAYIVIAGLLLLSAPLILLLFGDAYRASILPLRILALGLLFRYLIQARGQVFVSEELLKLSLISSTFGVATNFILNVYAIPRYGAPGAAAATLVSLCATLTFIFLPKTHFRWIGGCLGVAVFRPLHCIRPLLNTAPRS